MATPREASKVDDAVEVAIARLSAATKTLQTARMSERTARSMGDPEVIDYAVFERLNAEKAFRQASAGEVQARAARAAARAVKR